MLQLLTIEAVWSKKSISFSLFITHKADHKADKVAFLIIYVLFRVKKNLFKMLFELTASEEIDR